MVYMKLQKRRKEKIVQKIVVICLLALVLLGCSGAPNANDDYVYDPVCGTFHKKGGPCPVKIPEPPKIPPGYHHRAKDVDKDSYQKDYWR